MKNLILEACVETLDEALLAEKNGAHRLELCSRLDLDGLTPDMELTKQVLSAVNIPVKVMVRPRGGDFIYSNSEIMQIRKEVLAFKELPLEGVVIGMLDNQHQLNLAHIAVLANMAFPLEVTIHKAIDLCADPVAEIEKLETLFGVTHVLTSGGAETAIEGAKVIKRMHESAEVIEVIAAGRITPQNLESVKNSTGVTQFHGRRIV